MQHSKEITERENLELIFAGQTPAWIPIFMQACAFVGYKALDRKPTSTGTMRDIFGVEFIMAPDGPSPLNTSTRQFELKDIADWRTMMPDIDLGAIDWEAEAAAMLADMPTEGRMVCLNAGQTWEQLHYAMGFEEALAALLDQPEAVSDCLNGIADFYIDAMHRVYPHLKPDIICVMDHVATESGLMMSPDTFRSIVKPVHKKIYDAVADLGASPQLHVDGLVMDIMADYAEVGVQSIWPLSQKNDFDVMREKYGIVCISGLDQHDPYGKGSSLDASEDEVRAAVRRVMDAYGPGGRFVFLWGPLGASPEQNAIINDEAARYGRQFYS